jgi:hypothetical protein
MDKGKVKDDLVAMYKSASVDPTGVKYIADKQAEKTDSQQLAAELGFMCASTMQCQPSKTAPPICQKYIGDLITNASSWGTTCKLK